MRNTGNLEAIACHYTPPLQPKISKHPATQPQPAALPSSARTLSIVAI